jgi:hypothetical protein
VQVRFGVGEEPGNLLRLRYGDPDDGWLQFAIHPAGQRIWANWIGERGGWSISNAAGLLLGPVLGGVLPLRGTVSLHGCVLEVGSFAVVILAESGVGKSTLAAAMAQRGHAVLSDDTAAMTERRGSWIAQPGYPGLRLGPATLGVIGDGDGARRDGGPVMPGVDKRYVTLSTAGEFPAWRFRSEPLRVGVIYELCRVPDLRAPTATRIDGAERVTTLRRYTRAALAPSDASSRADGFARLSRIAVSTSIRRLACPDSLEGLPAVCETLIRDVESAAQTE